MKRMSKNVLKAMTTATVLGAGIWMTGCSDFQRGLVAGTAAGVVTTAIYNYHGHNFGPNRSALYRAGVRDGCRSAEVRWTRNAYRWRTYADYRDGWRAGYRACTR